MKISIALVLVAFACPVGASRRTCQTDELREMHPILCKMLDRLQVQPMELASEITEWAEARSLLMSSGDRKPVAVGDSDLPVVFAHGMGDSCFNSGMQRITKYTSDLLNGVYSTCIATGKNQQEDTTNGYFLNMDASVDIFAEAVKNDPNLAQGFHAIGFSQGNNVIRGYIARYNNPPVHTFLSINGVNGGEGAVPYCFPKELGLGGMCDLLMEQASRRAYTEWAQEHSFQANYWRDPRPVEKDSYAQYSQLAQWNNEGRVFNQTLKDNFAKTKRFVWVMAEKDEMVWPKEGEQWGAPDPNNPFEHILPMNQTEWYTKDLFGLRSAQEAGKNYFESFDGTHLQFSMDDFDRWVKSYLVSKGPQEVLATH